MTTEYYTINLYGKNLLSKEVEKLFNKNTVTVLAEKGAIAKVGRYKGKPAPYTSVSVDFSSLKDLTLWFNKIVISKFWDELHFTNLTVIYLKPTAKKPVEIVYDKAELQFLALASKHQNPNKLVLA